MLTRPSPLCSEVRRELEAFALGEVPAADRALVRQHFRICPACAQAAREAERLVRSLEALGPPRVGQRLVRATAAVVLGVIVILVWQSPSSRAPASRPLALPAHAGTVPGLADLVAAQAPDGAWREPAAPRSPVLTVGLSGLATLGCLSASADDEAARTAAQHGCDFLLRSLAADPVADADLSPDLRLRSQAAAAWALGVAAQRWPDRYRHGAIKAVRALAGLEESCAVSEGKSGPSDLTRVLVASAYGAASALGMPEVRRGGGSAGAPGLIAARLVEPARPAALSSTAPITALASRVLAEAIPRRANPIF